MMNIENTILDLISRKVEGDYWDFKRQWYESNLKGKESLLHDIICMANNLVNRDAYIIIGVDESEQYDIRDVSDDTNRKNTNNLNCFLREKSFYGGIRPSVEVVSMNIGCDVIDVIVIPNNKNTPFILSEDYGDIKANHIYTRVGDGNTPKNKSADLDKMVWLWKKRFGMVESAMERVYTLLGEPKDWHNIGYNLMDVYHKNFPTYRIVCEDENYAKYAESEHYTEFINRAYRYYLFTQIDPTPCWLTIKIFYQQTTIFQTEGVVLDGYMTPSPKSGRIGDEYDPKIMSYRYMVEDSLLYRLNQLFLGIDYSDEARVFHDRFMSAILLFKSDDERKEFERYAQVQYEIGVEKYSDRVIIPHIPKIEGQDESVYREQYIRALILRYMLDEFRTMFV